VESLTFPPSQGNGSQPLSRDQRRARYLGDNFDYISEIRGRPRIASIDDLFGNPGSYKLHNVIGVFRKSTHLGNSRDVDHQGFVYLHANVPNLNSTTAGQFDFGSLPNPNIADYQSPATRMNTATRATPAFLMLPSDFVSQYFPYIIGKNSDGTYYNSGKIKFEFNDSGFETYADPSNAIHGKNIHNIIVAPARPEYDYLGLRLYKVPYLMEARTTFIGHTSIGSHLLKSRSGLIIKISQ
jgi:hypothetical protein